MKKKSIDALSKIYKECAQQAPELGLVESEFVRALRQFRTSKLHKEAASQSLLRNNTYASRLFNLLDSDGNQYLSYKEFVVGLGCRLCANNMDEKINCTYKGRGHCGGRGWC